MYIFIYLLDCIILVFKYSDIQHRNILFIESSKLIPHGDCAFRVAGPSLWNRLPESVKSATSLDIFKSLLKIAFQIL